MTGYARSAGGADGWAWSWELKSVNGRRLDLRFRLPPGLDRLEGAARQAAGKAFSRGNISAALSVTPPPRGERVRINRAVLDQVVALARELQGEIDAAAPRIDGLLAIRGVVEAGEAEAEDEAALAARDAAMLATLDQAIAALAHARREEGRAILAALNAHVDEVEALTREAARLGSVQPEAIKARISSQLAALLGPDSGIAPERLAQEVALMAVRADVREEIDRLIAHVAQARALFAGGGAFGRKLEFLAQEFNREANTLCSKSADLELTRIGLALKAAIDRLREQSANVE